MAPEATAAAAARDVRGSARRRGLWLGVAGVGARRSRFPGPRAAEQAEGSGVCFRTSGLEPLRPSPPAGAASRPIAGCPGLRVRGPP